MLQRPTRATYLGWIVALVCATNCTFAAPVETASLVRSDQPDWPQWRGPRRDGVSDETGLLQSWPAGGPKCLWTATDIANGYSSPIVVGETIYITGDRDDDLVISALTTDGPLRWRTTNGASWQRSFPGARSACTYDGGRLYHMNAHGRLVCLDPTDGTEIWAVNVLERFAAKNITWGISESPLIHGGHVFVTPAGAKGLMAALDKRTGAIVWTTEAIDGEQASYASPILVAAGDRRLLINAGSHHAFAVDAADGTLVWKMRHLDPGRTIVSTPIFAGNRLVITNSSREFGGTYGVQFDGIPGERAWSADVKISHGGTVCVDGRVVGASSRGDAKGWITLDPGGGDPASVGEQPRGSLSYADGRFYCLAEAGAMMLQELTDNGFQTRGSFQLAEGKNVWAHPVICRGRLLLRYHDTLFCYDVRRKE